MHSSLIYTPLVYRDPRSDALARIDAARDARARTWAELMSLLEATTVLHEQLAVRGIEAPRVPAIEPPLETPVALATMSLPDALRAADAIERDDARLQKTTRELTTLVAVLGDRVRGKNTVLPLAPPPRAVPGTYALSEVLPAWLILAIPVAGIAGGLLSTMRFARGFLIVEAAFGALPVSLLVALTSWRAAARMRFLRRCRVASSVTLESMEDTATSNTNVPMRFARGWKVTRESYTGETVRNHLRWISDDGRGGTLVVRGTPYEDGVVLHDETSAVCVVSLACEPRPDHRGQWDPSLPATVWLRIVFILALLGALVFLLVGHLRS